MRAAGRASARLVVNAGITTTPSVHPDESTAVDENTLTCRPAASMTVFIRVVSAATPKALLANRYVQVAEHVHVVSVGSTHPASSTAAAFSADAQPASGLARL
jgi:hypothetical protein